MYLVRLNHLFGDMTLLPFSRLKINRRTIITASKHFVKIRKGSFSNYLNRITDKSKKRKYSANHNSVTIK